MSDITTLWLPQAGAADWALLPDDLRAGVDLETAVLISLFTDRRALASDVLPAADGDRRGWWGDADASSPIGSRLWLLRRAKALPATLQTAEGYVREALQWLVDDGVAAAVVVACSFPAPATLGIGVQVLDAAGGVLGQWRWAWRELT